ncbi:hypothetical protein N9154_04305, partial [Akkermansiaceae bacterium]|nr:hypothetical protein [Akkermansiaceae bacterium]
TIAKAVGLSYQVQLAEKMDPLPEIEGSIARKYCGGGHGGYALYLFAKKEDRERILEADSELAKNLRPIEPHDQWAD